MLEYVQTGKTIYELGFALCAAWGRFVRGRPLVSITPPEGVKDHYARLRIKNTSGYDIYIVDVSCQPRVFDVWDARPGLDGMIRRNMAKINCDGVVFEQVHIKPGDEIKLKIKQNDGDDCPPHKYDTIVCFLVQWRKGNSPRLRQIPVRARDTAVGVQTKMVCESSETSNS